MIPSLRPSVNQFLNNLSTLQSVMTTTTEQLSSGYRIGQPSDAPDEISPLLQLMSNQGYNGSVVENLASVQANVSGADQAVSTGIQLLQQATSLGAQGASSTATAATRAQLAQQLQSIQEQMVALANTQVAGQYVFGGDHPTAMPYQLDLNPPPVAIGNTTAQVIQPGDTATFTIQTTTGVTTITIAGQAGDTLKDQINELNAQLQTDPPGITASLDSSGRLDFQSGSPFSITGVAGNSSNLVGISPQSIDNTGLNIYRFAGQAAAPAGGSDIQITVGGVTAAATLTDPAAPTQADVDAINTALQAQGITNVNAVLDLTQPNAISFQGSTNFSVADDHLTAGTFVNNGNSSLASQNGVDRLMGPQQATGQADIGNHSLIAVSQTAQDLFDHRNPDDSIAADNVFAALNFLRIALTNNDTAGIMAAQSSLGTASQYLNAREVFYGATENRLSAAITRLNSQNIDLQQQISAIRDTNVAQAAEMLTQVQAEEQAALDAAGKFPRVSLFDYLG